MGPARYLVVGGGLAAVNALQAIRERDKTGEITLVTDEAHLPYDRVPLSKAFLLDKVKEENLHPKKREFFDAQRIELRLGRRATSLDAGARVVELDDGSSLPFDRLLLATGGQPRRLSLPGADLSGVHYFRTLDDCATVKQEMSHARNALIVGGGFIGCELAAAFNSKGIHVTIVEVAPSILSLAFDPDTAGWIEDYFRGKGVGILTNTTVTEFVGEGGHVTGVKTKAGTLIPCDLAIVGVGIVPNTELAERAGIKVDRGILVDELLETSAPDIFAAGDAARFYHPSFGHHIRVEHYDVAVRHGKLAGANMAGAKQAFTELPYFFSYLFDLTINAYGDMSRRDDVVRRGSLGTKGFLQFFFADGTLRAFLSMNRPYDEVKTARRILLGQPNSDRLTRIADESVGLQSFVPS